MRLPFLALAVALSSATAAAQSMTPMRGEVSSFRDTFAIRVFPRNPYRKSIPIFVRVYDADFNPVRARVAPSDFRLGPGLSRSVLVVVPFEGQTVRRVRICTESVPNANETVGVRTQICGKFIARRRG